MVSENEALRFETLFSDIHFFEILDKIDAGIAIYDAKGNYVFVNRTMITWRNLPREEFLKLNVHDFIDYIDICVFDLVCQSRQPIRRLQYYQNIQDPSLARRVRIVKSNPVLDKDGKIQYVIVMMQDIESFHDEYKALIQEHLILAPPRLHTAKYSASSRIIAESPEMKQLLSIAENISLLDSTVLLYGESGTGKDVFAHFIHEHSSRRNKPFIIVNCASIPENLMEAELFGYEKGSFTGASKEGKTGLVEAADSGTLFLDEINSLPLSVQGKLLRTIEDKSIQKIGSLKAKKVDFRLITASNQDLKQLQEDGKFREDLYYRLNVIPLTIPPLRDRKQDIRALCLYFLEQFCEKYKLQKTLSESIMQEICSYRWPGNVRELRNYMERLVVMTPYTTTLINMIPKGISLLHEHSPSLPSAAHECHISQSSAASKKSLSREIILEALKLCDNRREDAAKYLGISRRYLQYKIREYHLSSRCKY